MCGHDDPHEADQAGDRNHGGGPERRRDDEGEPHPAHVHAEARRLVVAEVQHVDDAPEREDDDRSDGHVREDEQDVRPARARDVPQDPGVDLLEGLRVLLLDERLPGGEERGHCDACEHEGRGVAFPARRPADRVGEEDRD